MAWPIWSLWLLFFISASYCVPSPDITRSVEFGLEHTEVKVLRERFEQNLLGDESNATSFEQTCRSSNNKTVIRIRISKDNLKMFDNSGSRQFPVVVEYSSDIPIHVFYDLDSAQAAQLSDVRWYWLPPEVGAKLTIPLNVTAKQIGLSYVRFWIGEGVPRTDNVSLSWPVNNSEDSMKEVIAGLNSESTAFRDSEPIGFPLMVLRAQGVVQLVFRIMVVVMVSIFTFTMGCGLDIAVMKAYAKRPVCPAIGFGCQFIIMPLVAFAIAKLVPIKQEFGFGLLTVGCSPGGGASNAWSLMLGGDINLSIIMTFISSLSCLFMMPLLLFIFGRFFIDVNRVSIPYGSIALQLLQITTPAMLGLGLRAWKPKIAVRLKHLTRPMFLFFIVFFLTFGIYANLSIFSLIWSYPIVMPTSALLPWLGFGLSALATFLLRQSRAVIVTVALETGIQNVGAAILVLLYSMTQPAGDLGAVMPITVSIFTPVPLYFALLGLTIKRRCCTAKRPPTELHETQALRGNVDEEGEKQAQYATEERKNGLISLAMTTDPHTVDVRPTVHPDGDTISI